MTDPTPFDDDRLRHLLREAVAGTSGDPVAAVFGARRRARRHRLLRAGAATGVAAALVAAATASVLAAGHTARRPVPALAGGDGVAGSGAGGGAHLTGTLVSFDACSAYLDYVRGQAEAAVGPYGLTTGDAFPMSSGFATPAMAANSPSMSVGAPAAAAAAPDIASTVSPTSSATYSSTNDQVPGADEPDTAKTDGTMVVTLAGSTLRTLDTSGHVLGALQLSGDTSGGLLLDGSTAYVLSTLVTGGAVGVTYQKGTAVSGFGPDTAGGPMVTPAHPTSPGMIPVMPGSTASPQTAQIVEVDLSDATSPKVVRTFALDGSLVAARLVGGAVRMVLRSDGPRLQFTTPGSSTGDAAATAFNRRLIASSTLADWQPSWQVEEPDGATSARRPLASCSDMGRATTSKGWSTLTVTTLGAAATAPGPGTSVVGAGDTVYATADHVWVAGPAGGSYVGGAQTGCCSITPPASAATDLYLFDFPDAGPPSFVASGSIPGWLIGPYAMDEDAAGQLRVAATVQSSSGRSVSGITVLAARGPTLARVGAVSGLGVGEFIRSVRYIGSYAYVVTFQTYDPLYVVDLSDPAHPVLVGQLDQPGFSEYLAPLPGGHLLGVGVTLTDNEPSGLLVATYDVSDPHHPRRLSAVPLATTDYFGGAYDPHAYLYWAPVGLAFVAEPTANGASVAALRIGTDGTLSLTATLAQPMETATRTVVVAGQAWAVTDDGVITAPLSSLATSTWHAY